MTHRHSLALVVLLAWAAPGSAPSAAAAVEASHLQDLTFPQDSRKAIERLNRSYYSLTAHRVEAIEFTVVDSERVRLKLGKNTE